ncbi:hypothetical protein L6452_37926 [Arctium lappa]|uniref:Uncharacterized protein n=1 Tax=Arctium lappa TaxID=4217 RepID=A0ACB8Y508_ARCLA|nr:hypothetical protein L6452_37926 [Arctium lappa]
MMLFLEGVDNRFLTVLQERVIIPKVWDKYIKTSKDKEKEKYKDTLFQVSDESSDEERSSATGRYITKKPKEYTDEDKRLIGLDSKVRAIIPLALPDEVYHSLVNISTAKEMWSTLCVLYEDREGRNDSDHQSEAYLSEADDEGEDTSFDHLTEEMGMLANFSKFKTTLLLIVSNLIENSLLLLLLKTPWINPKRNATHAERKANLLSNVEATLLGNPNPIHPTPQKRGNYDLSLQIDLTPDNLLPHLLKIILKGLKNIKQNIREKKERNENSHRRGKGLMVESHDWVDEPTSDSEKEITNKCLMAKLDDLGKTKDSDSMMDFSAECSSSSSQVHLFHSLSDDEKIEAYDSLTVLYHNEKDARKRANAQIKSLSSQLQVCISQLNLFDKTKAELEDLKTINFVLAKEKNKLFKQLQKEQEVFNKWTTSSKNLENVFKDRVTGDNKFGLGYGKMDDDYTPTQESLALSIQCIFVTPESLESLYPPSKTKTLPEEDQDSNELAKPVHDLFKTLNLKEASSSSSSIKKPSFRDKVKSVVFDLPSKRNMTPSSEGKSHINPTEFIPRSVNLKKSMGIFISSFPSSEKGILGLIPTVLPTPSKLPKSKPKGKDKRSSQESKKVFIYRKCYNYGDTFHLTKDCPKEHIDRYGQDGPSSSSSNLKGPTLKWVPKDLFVCVCRIDDCLITDRNFHIILSGSRKDNVYVINMSHKSADEKSICFISEDSEKNNWLWHKRLSHLNFKTLNALSNKKLVVGLPKISFSKEKLCASCEKGKLTKSSFKSKQCFSSTTPLQMLHMDLCGPVSTPILGGKSYILVIVDEFTRYTWVFFLRYKSDTSEKIINFIKKSEVLNGQIVRSVRSDNGTEFRNATLDAFFSDKGISQNFAAVRTPQQNGVVERKN